MTSTIFHHNDADGIASAAIILELYSKEEIKEIKCIEMDYGKEIDWNDVKDNDVFIVDFSFPPDIMKKIVKESKSLHWIDHHKTAMDNNPDLWNNKDIKGIRSLDKSGCELTWDYFFPDSQFIPYAIQLIGDYDLWLFRHPLTKEFQAGLSLEVYSPKDSVWNDLLSESNIFVNRFISKGETLLKAQHKRVSKSFRDGYDIILEGFKTRVMNSNNDISDTGHYACEKGYDIGLVWSIRGNKVIVGLRSIGDINVAEIAEKHGGGGHKCAASFHTDIEKLMKILNGKM